MCNHRFYIYYLMPYFFHFLAYTYSIFLAAICATILKVLNMLWLNKIVFYYIFRSEPAHKKVEEVFKKLPTEQLLRSIIWKFQPNWHLFSANWRPGKWSMLRTNIWPKCLVHSQWCHWPKSCHMILIIMRFLKVELSTMYDFHNSTDTLKFWTE